MELSKAARGAAPVHHVDALCSEAVSVLSYERLAALVISVACAGSGPLARAGCRTPGQRTHARNLAAAGDNVGPVASPPDPLILGCAQHLLNDLVQVETGGFETLGEFLESGDEFRCERLSRHKQKNVIRLPLPVQFRVLPSPLEDPPRYQ